MGGTHPWERNRGCLEEGQVGGEVPNRLGLRVWLQARGEGGCAWAHLVSMGFR